MRLSAWSETGLAAVPTEIAAAIDPLLDGEARRAKRPWAREVRKHRRRILRGALQRRLAGRGERRDHAAIVDEYDAVWGKGYERYRIPPAERPKPWIWGDRPFWASSIVATRFRQVILARVIEKLRPRRVLEVGCGDGINLILLACRFPDIEFAGLELTPAGHAAATGFQAAHERIPETLQAYAPLPLIDTAAFRRIRFVQGSAAQLPFEDDAFDLVLTVLALEQMERIRERALREIARVSARHALMLEPFRDVNRGGWLLLNRIRRDYFRGRIDELPRCGLMPEVAVDDYPQEMFLRTCLVLSRKGTA